MRLAECRAYGYLLGGSCLNAPLSFMPNKSRGESERDGKISDGSDGSECEERISDR